MQKKDSIIANTTHVMCNPVEATELLCKVLTEQLEKSGPISHKSLTELVKETDDFINQTYSSEPYKE